MPGDSNFPTALDDAASLFDVTDAVTPIEAAHHNNLVAAMLAVQAKLGILNTTVPTSLDARLGHPTLGHTHDGATGQGALIGAAATLAGVRTVIPWNNQGSVMATANMRNPFSLGKTMQLESVRAVARRGPSGATAAFDVNFGPTSIWSATQANRVILAPGATVADRTAFNYVTYPSGAIITVDGDNVGSSAPTEDLSLVFVFRN